jgi:hypothetical protein
MSVLTVQSPHNALQVEKYKMPLFKTMGRFWVALSLSDYMDVDRESSSRNRGSNGDRSIGRRKSSSVESREKHEQAKGLPAGGVIKISNRFPDIPEGTGRSRDRDRDRDREAGLSASVHPALAMEGLRPNAANEAVKEDEKGEEKGAGDFSVPVGVSSKRRKLEGGGHSGVENVTDFSTKAEEVAGLGLEQGAGFSTGVELGREPKKVVAGAGVGAGVAAGGFVMPTGLGVSNKRAPTASKRDRATELEAEIEKDKERERERERDGPLERRLLYEACVRHTTLGLDMSLSHIHKFVGHRYDHDLYTQVSNSEG